MIGIGAAYYIADVSLPLFPTLRLHAVDDERVVLNGDWSIKLNGHIFKNDLCAVPPLKLKLPETLGAAPPSSSDIVTVACETFYCSVCYACDINDDSLIAFDERILDSGNRHGSGGATGWNNDLSTTARV